jgi:hypothetical protein
MMELSGRRSLSMSSGLPVDWNSLHPESPFHLNRKRTRAMTQQLAMDETATAVAVPHQAALQEISIYSHSTLLYWWPAWAFGFVFALLNAGQEKFLVTAEGSQASSALGLTFVSIVLLLIVFTNVRLRGIHSVVALLSVAFVAVLLAWFGWWDDIAKLIPYLSVHMNTGFYLVFSTGLLIIWLMMFFVFDRLTYWRIRPGQMTEEHLIGGGAESFDTNGLRFQKHSSDFFRAALGLGAGDLKATAAGDGGAKIEIPNVIFVDRKVHAIEKLISVKPERTS